MKFTYRTTIVSFAFALLSFAASPGHAQLTTTGLKLNFEADADTSPGNGVWESTTTTTTRNWALGGGIGAPVAITTGPAGITAAYDFPASGTNLGANKGTAGAWNTFAETADATFELWIQADTLGANQVLWETGGNGSGASINVTSSGNAMFVVKNGGSSDFVTASIPGTTSFHQIVGVYNRDDPSSANTGGDTLRLYIDGVLQTTGDTETGMHSWSGGDGAGIGGCSTCGASPANDDNQHGGSDGAAGALGYNTFNGKFGIMRFYENKALTDEEIWSNYAAVNGKYWKGHPSSSPIGWQSNGNWFADEGGTDGSPTRATANEVVILHTNPETRSILQINNAELTTGSFYVLPDADFSTDVAGTFEVREGGSTLNNSLTLTHQRAIDFRSDGSVLNRILEFNADGSDSNRGDYNLAFANGSAGSIIDVEGATDTVRISFDIVNAGTNNSVSITKQGPGTLELFGPRPNTYTGDWIVNGGTLQLAKANALGDAAKLTVGAGATADLAGFNETIGDLDGSGTVVNDSATNVSLTVNKSSGTSTFSGIISNGTGGGTLALTKSGGGTLELTGANTYTGTTTVNGGTLELVNAAITSGRDYGPIATGATLEFDRTSGSVNVGVIDLSGGGTFKKSGNGTITHVSAGSTVALGGTGLFHVADGTYIFGATGLGNWTNNLADLQVDTGATFRGEATAIYVDALTGGGSVQIGGVAGGGALNGDGLTVGVNNGSGTFSGTISDATNGNQHSLTKVGTGTQTLSGALSYTGTTTVNGGTLELVNAAITSGRDYGPIATGATLEFDRTSGSVNVGVIDLSGGGTFKKSGNGTITHVSAGSTVALGGTGLFHVADGTYIFGATGLGNWTNNLADLQVDTGATFRGEATAIYVDALTGGGSVQIGGVAGGGALNGDGLTVGVNNGSGTFSGTISDATNGNQHSLTKVGTGTQTLSGALSYTGTTTVNGGTLELVNAAITSGRDYGPIATGATLEFDRTSGSVNVGVIDLSGGGTFKKSGNGTITHVSAGSTVALGGTGLFHVADGTYIFGATGLGNWTNNLADLQVDTGATFRGEATAIYVDALTGGGSVQIGGVAGGGALNGDGLTVGVNNGSGTFSGTISDATNGNQHSLTKVGTGTQTLSGNNTYTGNTTIVAGTLQLGASGVIPDVSPVVQSGGTFNLNNFNETIHSYQATGGTLNFGGNSELTVLNDSNVNNITVGTTGILHVADGVTVTQSGTTSLLGPNESLTFDVGVGALANMSGDINTGKGDGQINKTGPGTLRLTSNASQYGGGNRIENGVLEFTSIVNAGTDETSSLGDADFQDVLQIGSNANAATLRMLGANAKNSSDRAVQLGNGGATIDIDDAGQKLTLSGVVSNHNSSGSLTKEGEGTLVLSGQNTYSGTTSVNAGELIINGNTSGQGDFTVASGARLGGDGTIGANVIIASSHGDISPGDKGSLPSGPFPAGSSAASFSYSAGTDFETVGSMGVSGDVDLGGYLLIDLMSQGTDMLNVGGEFTINTNQNAQLEINGTTDLSEIDFWSILDWTAPGPSIDLVTFSNFGGGQFANVGFNQEFSDAGGHSVVLGFDADSIFLVATPEPESIAIWSLLGLALAGFGYYRTRCK